MARTAFRARTEHVEVKTSLRRVTVCDVMYVRLALVQMQELCATTGRGTIRWLHV